MTTPRTTKGAQTKIRGNLAHGATVVVDTAPIIDVLEGNPQFCDRFIGLFEAAQDGHPRLPCWRRNCVCGISCN